MVQKRKFLFLYLTTGAGHISTARVLKEQILKKHPDAEIVMINGFDRRNFFGKVFFEQGYFLSTNYLPGAFPLTYDMSNALFPQWLVNGLVREHTVKYLLEVIEKEQPTDIVSFHFALTPQVKTALIRSHKKINFTCMVTDPFTMPKAWFYRKDVDYLVYSEEARQFAVNKCKVPEERVRVVPFVLNAKYQVPFNENDIAALREKHGFDKNKKVVLMVGGGDGIPGATKIINKCILRRADFAVAIICGKDKGKKLFFEKLKKLYPRLDLHVYSFVNYLDELVKLSDCVVMKAGPATLIEVLSCRKPVIICRYIHNQELGNMRFAVRNKVGWFVRKPGKIYDKVEELLSDKNFTEKMKANFDNLVIDTDSSKIADYLLGKQC